MHRFLCNLLFTSIEDCLILKSTSITIITIPNIFIRNNNSFSNQKEEDK